MVRRATGLAILCLMLGVALPATTAAAAPTVPDAWPQLISGGYNPMPPTRLVDTRSELGGGAFQAAETRTLDLITMAGLQTQDVHALAINVTVVEPSADTFVTVFAGGQPRPDASNINAAAGATAANQVIVGLNGYDGLTPVAVYNHSGAAHLVIDITGWYGADDLADERLFPLTSPVRFLDTRAGTPSYQAPTPKVAIGPGETRAVPTNLGGYDRRYVFNITAVGPSADSFLTVWTDGALPATSNLNLTAGQTVANIAYVGSGETLSIYNHSGTVHVVLDVIALTIPATTEPKRTAPGEFSPVATARLLDTRSNPDGPALGPGAVRKVPVAGRAGVPKTGASTAVLNVVAVRPTAPTFLTVWSGDGPAPWVSSLNAGAGAIATNLIHAPIGADGSVSLRNHSGAAHVVVDIVGWYAAGPVRVPSGTLSLDPEAPSIITFDAPGQVRTLTFEGTAGQMIQLDSYQWTGDEFADPAWRFVAPGGQAFAYKGAPWATGGLSATLPTTGTYAFEIAVYAGRIGQLKLGWTTTT